jgi:hypothetical protein
MSLRAVAGKCAEIRALMDERYRRPTPSPSSLPAPMTLAPGAGGAAAGSDGEATDLDEDQIAAQRVLSAMCVWFADHEVDDFAFGDPPSHQVECIVKHWEATIASARGRTSSHENARQALSQAMRSRRGTWFSSVWLCAGLAIRAVVSLW